MAETVTVDGEDVQIELSSGKVYLAGEMAGNIDFQLRFSSLVPERKVLDCLQLKISNSSEVLEILGSEKIENGLEVTVYSESLSLARELTGPVEVFWADGDQQGLGVLDVEVMEEDDAGIELGEDLSGKSGCAIGSAAVCFMAIMFGFLVALQSLSVAAEQKSAPETILSDGEYQFETLMKGKTKKVIRTVDVTASNGKLTVIRRAYKNYKAKKMEGVLKNGNIEFSIVEKGKKSETTATYSGKVTSETSAEGDGKIVVQGLNGSSLNLKLQWWIKKPE